MSDSEDSFTLLANLLKMMRSYVVLFLSYMAVFMHFRSDFAISM